ncbi:hypothetical protein GGX14DRAFT_459312 [Mycena pura]|uniref:Uncharacterized protein n=1 Tax=Mycena pura TaxID=153505 RepID=A0AAD6VE87_9AGAR|nr:hypothetical protein GGX14DRAFT_459312 [Mycena pura]
MGPKASAAPADTIYPLESVYFASLILVSLQQEFLKPATDTSPTLPPLPTLGAAAHSVSTTGKFANNLATCLNRGRKSLQHRVLAVVPGPVMREQLNALLFTDSPPTSPNNSPNISPSNSSMLNASQGERSLLVTENSWSTQKVSKGCALEKSFSIRCDISKEDDLKHGERIMSSLQADENNVSNFIPDTFSDYATFLTSLLLVAARKRSESAAHILQLFVVANCIARLQTRASTVKNPYSNLDPIFNWVPTPADNVQPQWLTVEEEHISRRLLAADIPRRENTFEFSEQSAGAWISVLLAFYVNLDKEIHTGDTVNICNLSVLLIELIKTVGVCLCAIPSFDTVCAGFAKIQEDGVESEDQNEEPPDLEDVWVGRARRDNFGRKTFTERALPNAKAFLRQVASLSTCVIAARSLLHVTSKLARQPKLVVEIASISPARTYIPHVGPDVVSQYWAKTAGWDEAVQQKTSAILTQLAKRSVSGSVPTWRGEVHCEATIMASLLSGSLPPPAEADGTIGEDVRDIFQRCMPEMKLLKGSVPIGVSRKCCPLCAKLADIAATRIEDSLQTELPGHDDTFFAWVPPHDLPLDILQVMEQWILDLISEKISPGSTIPRSTQSSPASDASDLPRQKTSLAENISTVDNARTHTADSVRPTCMADSRPARSVHARSPHPLPHAPRLSSACERPLPPVLAAPAPHARERRRHGDGGVHDERVRWAQRAPACGDGGVHGNRAQWRMQEWGCAWRVRGRARARRVHGERAGRRVRERAHRPMRTVDSARRIAHGQGALARVVHAAYKAGATRAGAGTQADDSDGQRTWTGRGQCVHARGGQPKRHTFTSLCSWASIPFLRTARVQIIIIL